MKVKSLAFLFVMTACVAVGCEQQPQAQNSDEAIQYSEEIQAPEEKIDYLASRAEEFLENEKYQDALATAEYVLFRLDQNSQRARDIIQSAQVRLQEGTQQLQEGTQQLQEDAQQQMEGTQNEIGKEIGQIEIGQ